MNKKIAELTVKKLADYHDKVVETLENAGFVLVLDTDTSQAECEVQKDIGIACIHYEEAYDLEPQERSGEEC